MRELRGQRDISFAEATRIIGKPDLKYIQFPYADAVKALTQFGFSESSATLEVELARAANEGKLGAQDRRNPVNTTLTRFEDFADELACAYQAP